MKVTKDKKVVNPYVVYEITIFYNINSYPTLENALFGASRLTKDTDMDEYRYFGHEIGFDGNIFFSYFSSGTGRNVIIFG